MPFLVVDLTSLTPDQSQALGHVLEGAGAKVIGRNPGDEPSCYRTGGPYSDQMQQPHFAPIIEKYGVKRLQPEELPDYRKYLELMRIQWTQRTAVSIPELGGRTDGNHPIWSSIHSGWTSSCHTDAEKNWKRTLHISNELFGIKFKLKFEHWLAGIRAIRGNEQHRKAVPAAIREWVANDYRVILAKANPGWASLSGILTNDIVGLGPYLLRDMLGSVTEALHEAHWEDPTNRLLRTIKQLKDEIAYMRGLKIVP